MENQMTIIKRWNLAQNYEKNWWQKQSVNMDLSFYGRFAEQVKDAIKPFYNITSETNILEIGSGAAGIITHIQSNYRFAIDPLEDFYSTIEKFCNYRDKKVIYQKAVGEKLPFEDNFFDLIIIDNVLDHCDNPVKVLSEMKRVLKKDGIVFFRQNIYHPWGKFVRETMELFKIDKGHPFTFTKRQLLNIISDNHFKELSFIRNGYFNMWKRELTSKRFIDKVKALLLVNRDKITLVFKNELVLLENSVGRSLL